MRDFEVFGFELLLSGFGGFTSCLFYIDIQWRRKLSTRRPPQDDPARTKKEGTFNAVAASAISHTLLFILISRRNMTADNPKVH